MSSAPKEPGIDIHHPNDLELPGDDRSERNPPPDRRENAPERQQPARESEMVR